MSGNELFGLDLAGIISDALSDAVFDVTITRRTEGARNSGNLTGGRAITPTEVSCRGFWADFTGQPPPGVQLRLNDRKAILFGDTIPDGFVPRRGDRLTVHEDIGDRALMVAQLLSRDPAAAVYIYLCRDQLGEQDDA